MSKHKELLKKLRELTYNGYGYYDDLFGDESKFPVTENVMEKISAVKDVKEEFYTFEEGSLISAGEGWKVDGPRLEDMEAAIEFFQRLPGMLERGVSPRTEIYDHAQIFKERAKTMVNISNEQIAADTALLKKYGNPKSKGDPVLQLLALGLNAGEHQIKEKYIDVQMTAGLLEKMSGFLEELGQELGIKRQRDGRS